MYHNQNRDADHQHQAGGQGAWGAGAGQDGLIMTPDGHVKEAAISFGTEARLAFLKRVYSWFIGAVLIAAAAAAGVFYFLSQPENIDYTVMLLNNWWMVFAAFIIIQMVAGRMMMSHSSAKAGLIILSIGWGVMFAPIMVVAMYVAGGSMIILWQALGLTVVTFGALTAYVFITKQDFSFLRGALTVGTVVLFGVIIIGFFTAPGQYMALGICGFAVLLSAGYTLYDTSQIMHRAGEGDEIMAAGMLLSDFAFMLWYILQILISLAASADG